LHVAPPDPRPSGRESRQFLDFLGRELTFFRNSLQVHYVSHTLKEFAVYHTVTRIFVCGTLEFSKIAH